MPTHSRRLACALVLVAVCGLWTPPASTQTPDVATLVTRALTTTTADERQALLEAHPELTRDPAFAALRQAAAAAATATDPAQAFNGYRVLIDAAARAGNDRLRILSVAALGTLASRRGLFSVAEPALSEAQAWGEAKGDAEIIITASNNLGISLVNQGRYDEALAS